MGVVVVAVVRITKFGSSTRISLSLTLPLARQYIAVCSESEWDTTLILLISESGCTVQQILTRRLYIPVLWGVPSFSNSSSSSSINTNSLKSQKWQTPAQRGLCVVVVVYAQHINKLYTRKYSPSRVAKVNVPHKYTSHIYKTHPLSLSLDVFCPFTFI